MPTFPLLAFFVLNQRVGARRPGATVALLAGLVSVVPGCGESAEVQAPADAVAVSDAGSLDMGADAGSVGRPCAADVDCLGVCVNDGAGLRCAQACEPPDVGCGSDQVCRGAVGAGGEERFACLAAMIAAGGDGSPCAAGEPCGEGLACADLGDAGVRCAPICGADDSCPDDPTAGAPRRCAPESAMPRVCVPGDSPLFSCIFEGCARGDLLCLVESPDVGALCLDVCEVAGQACPSGGRCSRLPADGTLYCAADASQAAGLSCASGGAAACAPGLRCTERWPGDARAVCAAACDPQGACPEDFACRRPAGGREPLCLPAPFGVGSGQGEPGTDCGAHGATDCRADLDCVAGVDGPVCARTCQSETDCGGGSRCMDRRADGPYCLQGAGVMGGACDDTVACTEGLCLGPAEAGGDPDARRCATPCEGPSDCGAGEACSAGICRVRQAGMAATGADCGADLPACASGLCVADPADGRPRCTTDCAETPCSDDLACLAVGARRFCF